VRGSVCGGLESGVGYKTEAGQEFWEGAVSAGMDWTGVGVLQDSIRWLENRELSLRAGYLASRSC